MGWELGGGVSGKLSVRLVCNIGGRVSVGTGRTLQKFCSRVAQILLHGANRFWIEQNHALFVAFADNFCAAFV